MFGKTFGKRGADRQHLDAPTEAVLAEIERRRPTDPLAGAAIGSQEVVHALMRSMTNQKGIHAESLLAMLGSLAGYACVMSVASRVIIERKTPQAIGVLVATTTDGRHWWFGNAINGPLAESKHSVWSFVGGAAEHLGASQLFDPAEVFGHVSATIGSPEFGVPRLPDNHRPGDLPVNYVQHLWPALAKIRDLYCRTPAEWPALFGLAAQRAMMMAKDTLDPQLAARIVFECAVPMSKLDPFAPLGSWTAVSRQAP